MFDVIALPVLYPVSAILWFWHTIFGAAFGSGSGASWALAVLFLVFSLRSLLLKPALSQVRSARKMRKLSPRLRKLSEKYKGDHQRLARETQKLRSEQGVSVFGGCLPLLVQVPVFLGLLHVLRGFHSGVSSNYAFDRKGVESFLQADFFGARLGNWISQPEMVLNSVGTDHTHMLVVGVPLMVIASIATFFTVRMSLRRQAMESMANPGTATMLQIMMYLAPLGVLISGFFLPIPLAVLMYFLATNVWVLGQQHFLTKKVDREEEREKERETAVRKKVRRFGKTARTVSRPKSA